MFSPVGYLSIKEVEDHIKGLNITGFTSSDFHERLSNLSSIFATSDSGITMRMSLGVLSVANDGEYAFVDRKNWVIDLDKVRDAAGEGSGLDVGVWVLSFELDDADRDPLWKFVNYGFADALAPFERQALVMVEDETEKLIKELDDFVAPSIPIERIKLDDEKAGVQDWIASYEGKQPPTISEREQWYRQHNISRDKGRSYLKKFAPESWQKPGRRKKP